MKRCYFTIRVIDKSTNLLAWSEQHSTKEKATAELKHMQKTYFNPDYFKFEIIGGK